MEEKVEADKAIWVTADKVVLVNDKEYLVEFTDNPEQHYVGRWYDRWHKFHTRCIGFFPDFPEEMSNIKVRAV